MALTYVNLSVVHHFNFMCKTAFERRIYHDSYREFQKRSKPFTLGQTLNSFAQMCAANEKAQILHQKLHYSVMNTVEALDHKIPVLDDLDGKPLVFDWAEFHIHSSDILNKAAHVVTLIYTTPKLILHEVIGDLLMLSYASDQQNNATFMLKLNGDISIEYLPSRELVYS